MSVVDEERVVISDTATCHHHSGGATCQLSTKSAWKASSVIFSDGLLSSTSLSPSDVLDEGGSALSVAVECHPPPNARSAAGARLPRWWERNGRRVHRGGTGSAPTSGGVRPICTITPARPSAAESPGWRRTRDVAWMRSHGTEIVRCVGGEGVSHADATTICR